MAKGLLQAEAPKGLVYWYFGAPEPEDTDKGKRAEEADKAREDERTTKE